MSERIPNCVVCRRPFLPGHGGQIHATRFEPGDSKIGTLITYQFCTDACMRAWLDRSHV